MLCLKDNQSLMNILAYSHYTDHRNIRADIDRSQHHFVHDKRHLLHMEMEHKDSVDLLEFVPELNIGQMDRQHNFEYIHSLLHDLQHDILHSSHKCSIHMGFCSVD